MITIAKLLPLNDWKENFFKIKFPLNTTVCILMTLFPNVPGKCDNTHVLQVYTTDDCRKLETD